MIESDWVVVETLSAAGPFTVVAVGSRTRSWSNLNRLAIVGGSAAGRRVHQTILACCKTANKAESGLDVRGRCIRVLGVPVLGEYGAVHGVQVWCGPSDQEPGTRRTVAAWEWNAVTKMAHHGPGIEEEILGVDPLSRRDTRTPPDFFRRVQKFDQRASYFDFVADLSEGRKWDGEITIRGEDGVLRRLHMLARAHSGGGTQSCRGLVHDISDVGPAQQGLDIAMLRAVANADGDPVGLISLQHSSMFDWLSPPKGPLQEWLTEIPTVHPADLAAWTSACARIREGESEVAVVARLRFADAEWVRVEATITNLNTTENVLGLLRLLGASTQ